MTWWHTQPVYPSNTTQLWDTIGIIPPFIENDTFKIYQFNIIYIQQLLQFINENYLTGYRLTNDYLYRKIKLPGSVSLVLMENNIIIGFIYSSPMKINNIECAYVDLMTVSKEHRNSGLAKILISAITNFSNKKHYIHKKDKTPLPFPYFFTTRHYTGNVKLNYKKHSLNLVGVNDTNIDMIYSSYLKWSNNQEFKSVVPKDTFISSESVKTYYHNDFIVSFAIFNFTYGFMRNVKIAEIFFINYAMYHHELYQSLLYRLKEHDIEFIIVQNNSFFREIILRDNYLESMELFLHSFNLNIPNTTCELQLPVF
jgi:hypothetical protein